MGTAQVQGELWGARAKDWVEANEPAWLPVYQSVLDHVGLRTGMKILDVGCGAGGALLVARGRAAEIFRRPLRVLDQRASGNTRNFRKMREKKKLGSRLVC